MMELFVLEWGGLVVLYLGGTALRSGKFVVVL